MADKLILFSTTGGGSGPRQYASTDDAFEAGALPGKVAGKVASGDTSPGMAVLFTQDLTSVDPAADTDIKLAGTGKFRVIDAWVTFSPVVTDGDKVTISRKVGATVNTISDHVTKVGDATKYIQLHAAELDSRYTEFSADSGDEIRLRPTRAGANNFTATAYVLAVRTE